MLYVVDTNILVRSIEKNSPLRTATLDSIEMLLDRGEAIFYTSQNVREFWNVCTRPITQNGLGLNPEQAYLQLGNLTAQMTYLLDTPDCYVEWLRLVRGHSVLGVKVHDANIVAAMNVNGIKNLLTWNPYDLGDFPISS